MDTQVCAWLELCRLDLLLSELDLRAGVSSRTVRLQPLQQEA